ncbi:Na/Pi cotransporter family protein [Gallibacter intestinalis]|uniref:Na/Pi cotransporter family protein n=1 Tax=Gallibacter intestinalis TaxID=2779356 RepID=A0ABR9QXP1_9FIRM|nr:Na/Pi cotransporter family protein [Gallibacter intestinalis]MBE5035623.1 Na/Pi cotransporter family protein [Gallibacter intestinalis]
MSLETFQMIVTLLGGLAVFIYGMNLMSDGLQKAAGDKMRNILGMLTKNPVMGVLAGALVTAVLQSSSATTVMVIGFTSAGLMKLRQAISVIMGANIGTTITAQLIAFNIGDFAWIFVFIGFIMYFFFKKKEMAVKIGQILFGFGLLFVGINTMSSTMEPMAESPVFTEMIMKVADIPVLGVFVGLCMTLVVQSSSATIAVLQNLAMTAGPDGVTSIIGLTGAIPVLFGDNIGTTITALLASIGGSKNAKRTAISHTIFNISGTLLFIWFVPQIAELVTWLSPKGPEVEVISRQIANTHLLFNLTVTILWLPFIKVLEKIVTTIIPGKDEREDMVAGPVFLDTNVLEQPVFATHLAIQELTRNASLTFDMLKKSREAFAGGNLAMVNDVIETDKTVNIIRTKTIEYLSQILSAESITDFQKERVSALLHVASDIEHIGDYCKNIVELAEDKAKNKYVFSDIAKNEVDEYFNKIETMLVDTMESLETGSPELAEKVLAEEEKINAMENEIRQEHMHRLVDNECSPAVTVVFLDVIHNLERMGDSCNNIAEAVIKGYRAKKQSIAKGE